MSALRPCDPSHVSFGRFGLAVWASALAAYLLVVAFCWYLTLFQIIPEEKALLAAFGPEFAQYMAKVRRWV